jgi:aryl-alcohol dehydrogenase-like predicted oxidoreductase
MRFSKLGHGPLKISVLGLGCMGMSEFYSSQSEEESLATIHRALDLGVNFLDTADAYGRGSNEELVGRALRGRRDLVVLATKFGNMRDAEGRFLGVNGRPEYVRQSCEASLRRLQVETIDLYYQHRVDRTVPIEETVGAMSRLVEEGKVRFLGLSEAAPPPSGGHTRRIPSAPCKPNTRCGHATRRSRSFPSARNWKLPLLLTARWAAAS